MPRQNVQDFDIQTFRHRQQAFRERQASQHAERSASRKRSICDREEVGDHEMSHLTATPSGARVDESPKQPILTLGHKRQRSLRPEHEADLQLRSCSFPSFSSSPMARSDSTHSAATLWSSSPRQTRYDLLNARRSSFIDASESVLPSIERDVDDTDDIPSASLTGSSDLMSSPSFRGPRTPESATFWQDMYESPMDMDVSMEIDMDPHGGPEYTRLMRADHKSPPSIQPGLHLGAAVTHHPLSQDYGLR